MGSLSTGLSNKQDSSALQQRRSARALQCACAPSAPCPGSSSAACAGLLGTMDPRMMELAMEQMVRLCTAGAPRLHVVAQPPAGAAMRAPRQSMRAAPARPPAHGRPLLPHCTAEEHDA